jgi:predicted neuraminidase
MRLTPPDFQTIFRRIAASRVAILLKAGYFGCFSLAVVGLLSSQSATGKSSSLLLPAAEQTSASEFAGSIPLLEQQFLESNPAAPSVHASTITQLSDGRMIAAWFGGTREGAKDVSIYGAHWDKQTRSWGTPSVIVDAGSASRELGRYVKKVGNPVLHCDQSGRVWLYYVTVSVGGWSGSFVTVKYSDDGGACWSDSKRLLSSPFFNISNLVRSVPLEMTDGSILLPVYHEFLAKYGEILHLSPDGDLIAKYRMGNSVGALQPTLAAVDDSTILAFHRRIGDSHPRVLANRSTDGGRTWTDTAAIDLPNPNASVAVVSRNDGGFLMALNASETERTELSLAVSDDGNQWEVIKTFPAIADDLESSYPTLFRADDGTYHLTYTWAREKICHLRFNDTWLEQVR